MATGQNLATLQGKKVVAGARQLKKALVAGKVQTVFLACNADPAITEPIAALCGQYGAQCLWVRTMHELGQACGIEVGATAAAAVDP